MPLAGFSKVGNIDLDDDDDDLQRIGQRVRGLFKKAEAAYAALGSKAEVLQLFTQAESEMAPLLANGGLSGLGPADLEPLLKGRLHQAVILANLEEEPDRWPRIKGHVESVLQFDHANCHARYLRSLALKAASKFTEAEQEMLTAVECARKVGKHQEADKWLGELEQLFRGGGAKATAGVATAETGAMVASPEAKSDASASNTGQADAASHPQEKQESKSGKIAGRSPSAQGLQKGFLQRREKKSSDIEPSAAANEAPAPVAAAPDRQGAASSSEGKPAVAASAAVPAAAVRSDTLQDDARQLLQEQRRLLEEQRRDLDETKRQLREERQQAQERQLSYDRRHAELKANLDSIADEFEEAFDSEASKTSLCSSVREDQRRVEAEAAARVRAGVAEAQDAFKEGKTWAEAQQQQYLELATEVLTLRKMASTELQERHSASRQQVNELKSLKKTMGELKVATKSLRDNVRLRTAGAPHGEKDEPAAEDISSSVADFRALPFSTRLAALTEDADVLRLATLSMFVGILVMLGIFVEGFSLWKCRFACSR